MIHKSDTSTFTISQNIWQAVTAFIVSYTGDGIRCLDRGYQSKFKPVTQQRFKLWKKKNKNKNDYA